MDERRDSPRHDLVVDLDRQLRRKHPIGPDQGMFQRARRNVCVALDPLTGWVRILGVVRWLGELQQIMNTRVILFRES
jgi:hypothetical protein